MERGTLGSLATTLKFALWRFLLVEGITGHYVFKTEDEANFTINITGTNPDFYPAKNYQTDCMPQNYLGHIFCCYNSNHWRYTKSLKTKWC